MTNEVGPRLDDAERGMELQQAGLGEPQAHERFLDLIQGLDAIVWEMDVSTWKFTFVSRRAEEILGYPIECWLAEPAFWSEQILHPDDRDWALDFCVSATRDSRDHEFEYRARAADGHVVWLRDIVRVIADSDGTPRLLRGVMIDITNQKDADREREQRERLDALVADVGLATTESATLSEILQRSAEAVVQHLDAAFARVWTLDETSRMLVLRASAGMYTHLDGSHSRVPVGTYKIGRIAEEKRPHLTNDVLHDTRVSDKDWARRESMVAFAGYPLLLEGRVLGVVALFSRQPLGMGALDALQTVAERLAQVVDRKNTEAELREREQQLAEAQRIAQLGSWQWRVGADVVEWSETVYEIFGLPPGSPVDYERYLSQLHPEDRDRVTRTVQRALETGESYTMEHRVVRPDGMVRLVFSEAQVERNGQGQALRIFGIVQDITERKEAAEHAHQLALEQIARKESEAARQQVQQILESITDAFFAVDREWRFTYVNEEAEQLLQRKREELLGASLWDEFPAAVGSTFDREYRRAVEQQQTVQFQECFAPLESWFEVRAYPSEDGLSVYFREINDQRRAEEQLRHQSELTRTITDNATAALFMMDTRGRCTFMNPAAEAMIGFTLDEVRDRALHDVIHYLHPDGLPYPMSDCPIDRALPENNDVRAHEDVFIRRNGEFFPVTCAARPIIRDGVPIGTVVEVRDITEAKQAEQELRQSEERFRSLIDATASIVWTTPASGEFGGEQPGWSRFTGQRQEQYEGWSWLDMVHPDDRARTAQAWKNALENRSLYEVEHRVRRQDGEYRYMLARAVPILEIDGDIREWVGLHADITERKVLEERQRFLVEAGALLSSSLHYETTLASVAKLAVPTLADWCAIDLIDENGEIHRVEVAHPDPAKRELALDLERRYPADPDAETGVPQVLRTGEPELVAEIPQEFLEAGAKDEEHLRIIRNLGLKSYIVVPLLARGRTLGAITLVSAESGRRYGPDDLDTVQELALRAAFAVDNARLVAVINVERARLSEMFMEAPAFIATLRGPDHVFETANPRYLHLVGHRDVVGKPVAEALPEVVEQGFIDLLDEVYRTGKPFVGNEQRVLLQSERDGPRAERFLNFVYQPFSDAYGATTGIFVHGVDISSQVHSRQEVERKAEELSRLAAALERSNRELDQFAYVTSHDLKAPLRGIANLAQWIEEDLPGDAPDDVKAHLELLKGRAHRMEGLIDGILQYSRAGRVRSEVVEVDTGAFVREVVDLLDPPEHLSIEISPQLPTLHAERLPLQQVFMNLIGNAIKYVERPDGRIRVEARELAGFYEFSVSDNGPGIAPEYHDRIFGIFQTLEARDKIEGTGIGLSLVKKIVEQMGGRVWVESEKDAGATFRFTWPA